MERTSPVQPQPFLERKLESMSEVHTERPLPLVDAVTRPFWEAAANKRLIVQRCSSCHAYVWTPRPTCGECGDDKLEWTAMSGRGKVYSYTVIRQVVGHAASRVFGRDIPYVVAWVDLEEGPRFISNLVDCDIESMAIGMDVTVVFEQASPDIWLPKFRPA